MKFRSFLSLLAVVVLVLLLFSAGGFYWLVGRHPIGLLSRAGVPGAAIFVPKQAPVMASLLLNPDRLETFQLVSTPPADRRNVRRELDQLKQLLATTGLDYKRDVQPWLGEEITLAVTTLDVDREAANGQQPGYLMAIATQEPQRSREFLELFWQKRAIAGSDLVFEQYKGVRIIAANVPAPDPDDTATRPKPPKYRLQLEAPTAPFARAPIPSLASAAVGDRFILFANHPKVLREAINNVQAPDLSLERSTVFTEAIAALSQPRLGLTFIDVSKLTQLLGSRFTAKAAQQTTEATATVKNPLNQTLVMGFAPNQYGLLAETALLSLGEKLSGETTAGETIALPLLPEPVGALQYLPSSSAIAASGTDLERLWTQLTNGLASYETASQIINQPLEVLQSHWQLDLPADVFSWVKGEYALAMVLPEPISTAGTRQPDWLFVAQRPQAEADQAIAHLDDLARQQGLTVGPLTMGDRTVSAWTRLTAASTVSLQPLNLQADVRGVHTSLGNYELFATSVAAMDRAFKAVDRSLLTNVPFQRATASLLQPNNGYLYLDWDASQAILEQRFPVLKVLELAGKPLFSHLRSLTLSSYGNQAGVQRGGALMQLKGR